ncbi:hypothetical protein HPB50_020335 [Hyalomma asiaticum]|uniref:Uncharacterized protein n=1 Tax=Hyalomma asiaticum TaxID=266040 RepID=A0ACB7TNM6_HYAAI|nr:hypothetical protein HPB50_020335 [Hyalomma asiaticum]
MAKKLRGFAKVLSIPAAFANKKAWMTGDIFLWLIDFDKETSMNLLISIQTADKSADLMVQLVKAIFFASRATRDVKKAGFSQGRSLPCEKPAAPPAAAGGATGMMSLGQLWESTGNANLVPPGTLD